MYITSILTLLIRLIKSKNSLSKIGGIKFWNNKEISLEFIGQTQYFTSAREQLTLNFACGECCIGPRVRISEGAP